MKFCFASSSMFVSVVISAGQVFAAPPAPGMPGIMPVPAPVAGAFGPAGLGVAAVAYCGYRIVRHYRNR